MVYSIDSKRFKITEMEDGTAETWIKTLTITTWKGCAQSQVGSDTVLLTVIYE